MPGSRAGLLIMHRDPLCPRTSAEHSMGMPASARRWTVEEVRELQDEERPWPRYELIEGELIVTPSPSRAHQRAAFRLAAALDPYLDRYQIGVVEISPADIQLTPGTIVQPDVFVSPLVNGRVSLDWRDTTSLLLAIEIVSPSSVRTDRVVKRRFFARHDVDEYWVVDCDARIVERTRTGEERPEIIDTTLAWTPTGASEPLLIDLPTLFAAILGERV